MRKQRRPFGTRALASPSLYERGEISIEATTARWVSGEDGVRFGVLSGPSRFEVLVTGEALARTSGPNAFFLSGRHALSAFFAAKDAILVALLVLLQRNAGRPPLVMGPDDIAAPADDPPGRWLASGRARRWLRVQR